jgi:hypothetical protein
MLHKVLLRDQDMIEAFGEMRMKIVVMMGINGVEQDRDVAVLQSHDRHGRAVVEPNDSVRLETAGQRSEDPIDVV